MNKCKPWLTTTAWVVGIILRGVVRAQEAPYYHFNRSFESAESNIQENLPMDLPNGETVEPADIVKGEPVKIDTNNTYAIERQAVVFGYQSITGRCLECSRKFL